MLGISLVTPTHHDTYPSISTEHNLKDAGRGRTVLITGAGIGTGKATAITFAQASATTIILVGRRIAKLHAVEDKIAKSYIATTVLAEALDVTDCNGIDSLFASLNERGIHPNVLINNAGVHLGQLSIIESEEIMVKGLYMLSRAFLRQIPVKAEQKGAIIMVSSIGSYALVPRSSAYGASKAALNRMTEWIATENKERVQAMAFHPGGVGGIELKSGTPDYPRPFMTETAELAAGTALYLTTPEAGYLSGRYVDARWDMEELEKAKERIVRDDMLKMSLLGDVRPEIIQQ